MRNLKSKDIKREWHLVDAKDKVLGRLSTEVALYLMGKNKTYYTPHLDCGDFVVVINAKNVVLSGKKENQKIYYHHSGFPGGLKSKTAGKIRSQKPEELILHAVRGMLPKNKLSSKMLKKLYVFSENENPFKEKFANQKSQ
jgi:large subunit ribosomal protein L13